MGFKEGVEKYLEHINENNNIKEDKSESLENDKLDNDIKKYYYHLKRKDKDYLHHEKFRLLEDAEDEAYTLSEKLNTEITIFKSICTIKPIVKPTQYIKIKHE